MTCKRKINEIHQVPELRPLDLSSHQSQSRTHILFKEYYDLVRDMSEALASWKSVNTLFEIYEYP